MRRKIFTITMIFVVALTIAGCAKENPGDTYVQGSDCQYMFKTSFHNGKAKGENGYFFLWGHYIYYLDDATRQVVPLCNKADCLHNEETDGSRFADCNAYVNNSIYGSDTGIAFCNGYLYFIEREDDENGWGQTLYRIKEDGSQREKVYHWNNMPVELWCIHRDKLYYTEHTYRTEKTGKSGSEAMENYAVKCMSLKGFGKKKIETIFEQEQGVTIYSLSSFQAYGNYVYFAVHGAATADTSGITDDNYLDNFYFKHFVYNTKTKELAELRVPGQENGMMVQNVTFWQDKIIMRVYDIRKELTDTTTNYIANLDGSDAKIFRENEVQGIKYLSDGKYLYVSNSPLVIQGHEEKQRYEVYDEKGNLVDILGMPFQTGGDPEIGMEDGSYIIMGDKDDAKLCYFDKSTIGTYDGEPYHCEEIAELKYTPADGAE